MSSKRPRKRPAASASTGGGGICTCGNNVLTVSLPTEVLPIVKYHVITAFAVAATLQDLKVKWSPPTIVIEGGDAFNRLKNALGLKLNTPQDFCNEFCDNVKFIGGKTPEVYLGVGSYGWRKGRAKTAARDAHLYHYGRAAWLFQHRKSEVSSDNVRPVAGLLKIAGFGRYFAHTLFTIEEARCGEQRLVLLLGDLSYSDVANRALIGEIYEISGGRIRLRERPRCINAGESYQRLFLNWIILKILSNIPEAEIPKLPTLVLVTPGEFASATYITGDNLGTIAKSFRNASEELGFGDFKGAARHLLHLLNQIQGLQDGGAAGWPVSRLLAFVEGALMGRVEWDLYYEITRALATRGRAL